MTEKVVGEIRFIETDDGFRIEVKGDKERLKEMGWGPGMGMGRGRGHRHSRKRFWRDMWAGHQHGQGYEHGPGHAGHAGHDCGPWSWWGWGEDEPQESGDYEKPPKNV